MSMNPKTEHLLRNYLKLLSFDVTNLKVNSCNRQIHQVNLWSILFCPQPSDGLTDRLYIKLLTV